jgi:hypothetical protein
VTLPDNVRPAPDADTGGQISTPDPDSENQIGAPGPDTVGSEVEPPGDTATQPPGDSTSQDVTTPPAQAAQIADGAMTYDEQETEEPPVAPPSAQEPTEATIEEQPDQADEATVPELAGPDTLPASALAEVLVALASLGGKVDDLAATTAELARLRTRDTDLISRLHDDVTKLRVGEVAAALNPVVSGMIKLHDQMVSLGALSDPASPVGMLFTQLLQTMELTCGVTPFTPQAGEHFDASRHTGTRRIPTTDASADGTIAGTIKAGFARADGSVVRTAEVEVHRLSV